MIRPVELTAIRAGDVDLAFRRWARPRVVVGTRLRTRVGVVEVTSVERVRVNDLTAEDARRAGAASRKVLLEGLRYRTDVPAFRVGLRYAGPDPRDALRERVPDETERAGIERALDRLDRASKEGPWTRATLQLIDSSPEVRAPDLAAQVGRDTADFKRDVRKLKELGLTQSLDIGYRLSSRGEAMLDAGSPQPKRRPPRPDGTPLPRIGAPATRALRAAGLATLESLAGITRAEVADLHGVGPFALSRLTEALDEAGLGFAPS